MEQQKKRRNRPLIFMVAAVVLLTGIYAATHCFAPNTCGFRDDDMRQYLEDCFGRENVEVLKIAQKGGTKAVLYRDARWGDPDKGFLMVFERHLFGLRWRQVGMDMFTSGEKRLYSSGSWSLGRCDIEVYGDNRGGALAGYFSADAPEIRREDLESDYILDIYVLNGIDHLPNRSRLQWQLRLELLIS